MLNRATVMGRLTRDPELKKTQNQISVSSFTLAVERDFKVTGQENKETDFIDIVVWRNTAEFVCNYFQRGQLVVVSGRIQVRDYEDKEGIKRRVFEIVADECYFAERKNSPAKIEAAETLPEMQLPTDDFHDILEGDGDLPF